LGSRFGVFPAERTPVIIFTTEEFWEAWSAPGWLGGFFDNRDGRVRVRMDPPPGGDEEFRRRLRHESKPADRVFQTAAVRTRLPSDRIRGCAPQKPSRIPLREAVRQCASQGTRRHPSPQFSY